MENQALNPCNVFASLFLFCFVLICLFFPEEACILLSSRIFSHLFILYTQRAPKNYAKPRIIIVSGSGIYFWFCHWFSEEFYSFFMHKSIFLPFLHLIFYCPLNIMKNLQGIHGFLPSQYCYLTLLLSLYVMHTDDCLLWLATQAISNLHHFLFHLLLYDCHLSSYSPCYVLNKHTMDKLIKLSTLINKNIIRTHKLINCIAANIQDGPQ